VTLLGHHIVNILLVVPDPQVIGVDAQRIVAGVADKAVRFLAVR
jgi:hypothetical protein